MRYDRAMIDRLFRDKNGQVVIAQRPNLPLWVWLGATVAGRLTSGSFKMISDYTALIALILWSGWEVWRGDNTFRRLLGGGVLIAILIKLGLPLFR